MENESVQSHTCFTCLQESSDPHVCSNCGAAIETIDLEKSVILPPIAGYVELNSSEDSSLIAKAVNDTIEKLKHKYHDDYAVTDNNGKIAIECSDLASERLMPELSLMFRNEGLDVSLQFRRTRDL